VKRHHFVRDRDIGPQEDLSLLLSNESFPYQDVYSILGSFGGFEVDRDDVNAMLSVPIFEETYRMVLITPKGDARDAAAGNLCRIQLAYRLDYAPDARWKIGLMAFGSWESLWLTHAIAYRALVLLDGCILFRPGDGKVFRDPDDWYKRLERWFWSDRFVSLGLAAEDGRLLI